MKNNLFSRLATFAFIALMATSCSEDQNLSDQQMLDTQIEESLTTTQSTARGVSDFTPLLNNLYGNSYRLGAITTITDNGVSYRVTEVTRSGMSSAQGYILETPNADYYYEHIASEAKLNEFTVDSDIPRVYDLSRDPNYNGEFTPTNSNASRDPFWGWGDWHNGPCKNNKRLRARAYHVLWFAVFLQVEQVSC